MHRYVAPVRAASRLPPGKHRVRQLLVAKDVTDSGDSGIAIGTARHSGYVLPVPIGERDEVQVVLFGDVLIHEVARRPKAHRLAAG